MADTKKSFLERQVYQPGEFERQQQLWDSAAEQLTRYLTMSVGNTLRKQIASDVTGEWVTYAQATLDTLLDNPPSPEMRTQEGDIMVAELRRLFLSTGLPDNASIDSEVESTCRELSQRVLTKWFDVLARVRHVGEAVPLNAVMLPKSLSLAQMVSGLDLETYAATLPDVVAALSEYQRDMVAGFNRTREPITFGTRLLVVPASDNPFLPFRLFTEEASAKQGATSRPVTAFASLQQCLSEIIQIIHEVMPSGMPTLHADLGRAIRTASFALELGSLPCAATLQADHRSFGNLVNLGLDAVRSGLAISVNTAEQNLKGQVALITAAIEEQARAIQVPPPAMSAVYTFTLTTALEANVESAGPLYPPTGSFHTVQQQFQDVFQVSRGEAWTLAETSIASLRVYDGRLHHNTSRF